MEEKNELQILKDQLKILKAENKKLKEKGVEAPAKKKVDEEYDPFAMDRQVTLMHMDDLEKDLYTVLKGSHEHKLHSIGDKIRVRLSEFETIFANHRRYFMTGLVCVVDEDIADAYSISANNNEFCSLDTFLNIQKLDIAELDKLMARVNNHYKDIICRRWYKGLKSGDASYKDVSKMSVINKYANGKLQSMIDIWG